MRSKNLPFIISIVFVGLLPLFLSAQQPPENGGAACISCEEIKQLRLADVRILEATEETEGSTYCKVLGVISKEINFELLLPKTWNGRFAMGGGGGFVGTIQNSARWSVHQGYATSGTDTGHRGSGLKADWAYHNMERQVNFGHLAIHRTAEVSKVIIHHFYCADPAYSYFFGCSRGGGQAMMEAQRYPEDFDGIVAAAPAFDWPAIGAEFIQNIRQIYPDPNQMNEPVITRENIQLLEKTVLAQCDELDGVKDNILNDPTACKLDWSAFPRCPDDQAGAGCFTKQQLRAIQTVYDGVHIEGKGIYPGFPPGCENEPLSWFRWIVGPDEELIKGLQIPSLQFGFGTEMFKYLVFQDPDWDYTAYDFTRLTEDTRYAASYLNATSTDYSAFKARGGKLIFTHGWADPALSALATIQHYEAIGKADADFMDFTRLYLLPGVLHCGGGPGPDQADWLQLVRDWVENDRAPERVTLTKKEGDRVTMSRPVFPYPRKAKYDGKGDPNVAGSYN
ncbi:tannase/feruloyl esterase family alpha/beta hydrolase [Flavilitoribacter nigricans]|uniref:Tannase/feruloyl esterase family alpha/beta hydrolase n=1 Tax=Flavilitoribacter nigricans (strain ATCC 23147 / DSM 23189 / NBRC 102662 / NCIMB 1420 / SS-2) TaxID=1122177 RepID=A0A2D0N9J1_FLAN2|nr:tannase/feruloyl esterase family alpha/beta hydrolase [Flavilitoribacter nigricans]PHN05191.1 hypothetical protein CRP01_16870 [Flavilitoribacter nigricans DSM 23189 = NBRC 102662]